MDLEFVVWRLGIQICPQKPEYIYMYTLRFIFIVVSRTTYLPIGLRVLPGVDILGFQGSFLQPQNYEVQDHQDLNQGRRLLNAKLSAAQGPFWELGALGFRVMLDVCGLW